MKMPQQMSSNIRIISRRGRNGEHTKVYARSDGMIIGACDINGIVQWGDDPKDIEVRAFISMGDGESYLKDKCREYLGRDDIDFLYGEGDPMIMPAQVMPNRTKN
jgi:hypothetical protein